MENRPHNPGARSGSIGFIGAILASALGHAALIAFVLFVMPRLLYSETVAPPTYTVKIVDDIPAGDLGTHLPRLAPEQLAKAEPPKPEEPTVESPQPPPADDKKAISLAAATPTPTPPAATPAAMPTAPPEPTATPQKIAEAAPTSQPPPVKPKPENHERSHKTAKPPVVVANADATPDVQEQLRKLRENLMRENLEQQKKQAAEDQAAAKSSASGPAGAGGPVVASADTEGKGYGIGPGTGSAGELQDLQFLLYYRAVQQKIKDAWTFPGGSNDLTASVNFSIGPDGSLTGVKIRQSSGDNAFDDSVVRAIRRAAPFSAPPDKYRAEFQSGVAAIFRLGELKS